MLKSLLVLAMLAGTAHADRFDVKASAPLMRWSTPSCGASKRMMNDKHRVVFKDGKVYINGMRWEFDPNVPSERYGWTLLRFHDRPGQLTYLTLHFFANDRELSGIYTLYGVDTKRQRCMDQVRVTGRR